MRIQVRIYVLLVVAAAAACVLVAGWDVPSADGARFWNALVAFAVLGFLCEASYLKVRIGRSDTTSSVAFIPYIAAVLLLDTGWAVTIAAAANFAAEYGVRKRPPAKIVFNVAQVMLSVALASLIYQIYDVRYGQPSLTHFHFAPIPTAAAVLTFFVVNTTAVTAVVVLNDELRFDDVWRRIAGPSLIYDVFLSALGPLLAFLYVEFQLLGIVILVLPILFVRHVYQVNIKLEQVNRDLLELMVKAIEARDPYTSGHSLRVAHVAGQLARERGLGGKLTEQITTAALLHDVGKIHEDFARLLRKETKLDATEKALMQTHPSRSADLVCTISAFQGPVEQAVRHHHESYDGTGYPMGLAGEAIPIGARIIMIADTMDAMTTDRPYRRALTFERVIEELRRFAGTQFDPALVELVVRSAAIKTIVAARLAREPLEAPPGGLAVFARTDRPARSNRAAAGA
jgi:putative nucleotidyltransferase with HDIG domain